MKNKKYYERFRINFVILKIRGEINMQMSKEYLCLAQFALDSLI